MATFQCTLITPERQLLDAQVEYASIPAWDGQMGVQHQRAPLLAKLGDGTLRIDLPGGQSKWFFLAGGFAQVKDDKLSLLTTQAWPAEEINEKQARELLSKVEAQTAANAEDALRKQRELNRLQRLASFAAEHGAG